eukprot:g41163.t1
MGEPEELVEGVGEINLNPAPAPAGFWKPWGEVEEKAPTEMKNPKLVRIGHMEWCPQVTRIHLGFECIEGVGHECEFPGQVVHCGGSRTNKRYPSSFLHSLSMAVGGGVVVLPGSAESVSKVGMSYVRVHLRGSVQVSVLMSQCPSVLVRAQVSVILFVTIRPRPIHCTPTSPKVRARHALVDVRSVGRATETEPLLPKRSHRADQMRAGSFPARCTSTAVNRPARLQSLVELELLELVSSSSSSDLTDRVVPLVPFLELSLDGRADVAALAVPGVGRVGVFLIDE